MNSAAVDKVLLVDDDKVTNLMHSRLIRQAALAGHIDIATDGEAALQYLKGMLNAHASPPEIILLDVNMPRMNGFEFLEEYRNLPETMRNAQDVVMLSTSVLHEDHQRAETDPNVREFVVKPIRKHGLQAIFEAYHARVSH